jgi:hypothetical protein
VGFSCIESNATGRAVSQVGPKLRMAPMRQLLMSQVTKM